MCHAPHFMTALKGGDAAGEVTLGEMHFKGTLFAAQCAVPAPPPAFSRGWTERRVAPGVTLKTRYFEGDLFASNQLVCVLEADLNNPRVSLALLTASLLEEPHAGACELVSAMASRAGAVAAVNHWMYCFADPAGSMYTLFKREGRVVSYQDDYATGATYCFGVTSPDDPPRRKTVALIKPVAPGQEWPEAAHAGAGYGLVLYNGLPSEVYKRERFNLPDDWTRRGPRTGACITSDNRVLFVTADGRRDTAAGLTLGELGKVMLWLGGRDGINFDGGGSTRMWIRDDAHPEGVIVNRPCDPKRRVMSAWAVCSRR